jgi:hypothetical protein
LATTAAVLAGGSSPSAVAAAARSPIEPTGAAAGDETFLFLCPNGHKLHGPVRMAGKVGKCPHCRAKFEVPVPHQEEDEDEPDGLDDTVTEDPLHDFRDEASGAETGPELLAEGPRSDWAGFDEGRSDPAELQRRFEALPAEAGGNIPGPLASQSHQINQPHQSSDMKPAGPPPLPATVSSPSATDRAPHPLAELVARLWGEREHGGVIELHLRSGALLVPEWFDEPGSQSGYGLFASQAADGTVTMTVVPWDEVTRVVVRGVVGLPDGMFE